MYLCDNFRSKLRLIRMIKAEKTLDYLKLVSILSRYWLTRRNCKVDMTLSINGVWYRLTDLESLFIVSPRYEEWIWKYLRPKYGDVFIDVGAHIGKYTLIIASIVGKNGKVIAIEPVPYNFEALLHGIRLNRLTNVIALNIALWSKECLLPLYIGQYYRKNSPAGLLGLGGSSIKRKVGKKIKVVAKTLDNVVKELNLNCVNWIKIDVEGSEREVLEGAKGTIRKYKPRIIAECTINVGETVEFMKSLGYSYVKIYQNYFYFQPM